MAVIDISSTELRATKAPSAGRSPSMLGESRPTRRIDDEVPIATTVATWLGLFAFITAAGATRPGSMGAAAAAGGPIAQRAVQSNATRANLAIPSPFVSGVHPSYRKRMPLTSDTGKYTPGACISKQFQASCGYSYENAICEERGRGSSGVGGSGALGIAGGCGFRSVRLRIVKTMPMMARPMMSNTHCSHSIGMPLHGERSTSAPRTMRMCSRDMRIVYRND